MKKFPFYFVLISFIGCTSAQYITSTPEKDIKFYKLKERVAGRMINRESRCGFLKPCHDDTVVTIQPDADLLKKLNALGTVTSFSARYVASNNRQYRTTRGLHGDTARVKGYKTMIYKLVPFDKNMPDPYYDISTICPPPKGACRANPN